MNGKIVKEKLTEFSIYDYVTIAPIIKAFQKKYRNQFIFKKILRLFVYSTIIAFLIIF